MPSQQQQRVKRMTTVQKKTIGLQDKEVKSKAKVQRKRAAAYV